VREGRGRLSRGARVGVAVALAVILATPAAAAEPAASRAGSPDGLALVEQLGATEPAELERVITAIERAPATVPHIEEALFRAGRACEDTLADPARALALYERILRDHPSTGIARAAELRAELLRDQVGADSRHVREAAELAQLLADADRLPAADVERRARALAAAAWPGAPDAAMFLAEWLQRTGRLAAAQAAYADITARWPNTPHADAALRGGASTAIAAGDWDRAEALTRQLPAIEPADRVMRDELLAAADRGRRRAWWYAVSWIILAGVVLALAGSLADAALRGGRRRPVLRPPLEVIFLLPVAAVLVGVALTTHQLVAPAVVGLVLVGLVLAYLSGTALETLRARGRDVRTRAAVHAVLAILAVAAMLYIVLMRDNLLDMVIETVRFGPED
jgi:hypothetical protein